jgi:hypothetical protein
MGTYVEAGSGSIGDAFGGIANAFAIYKDRKEKDRLKKLEADKIALEQTRYDDQQKRLKVLDEQNLALNQFKLDDLKRSQGIQATQDTLGRDFNPTAVPTLQPLPSGVSGPELPEVDISQDWFKQPTIVQNQLYQHATGVADAAGVRKPTLPEVVNFYRAMQPKPDPLAEAKRAGLQVTGMDAGPAGLTYKATRPASTELQPVTMGGQPVAGMGLYDGKLERLPDPKDPLTSQKLDKGEKALLTNMEESLRNLEELKSVIERRGTWEMPLPFGLGSQEHYDDVGKLTSLPYKVAIGYAKIVDPDSVAREGEVAAAKKYLVPTGLTANNEVAVKVISDQIAEMKRRRETFDNIRMFQGLPEVKLRALTEVDTKPRKFASPEEAQRAAAAGDLKPGIPFLLLNTATGQYDSKQLQ